MDQGMSRAKDGHKGDGGGGAMYPAEDGEEKGRGGEDKRCCVVFEAGE